MVLAFTWHFPSSDSDEDASVTKQQPKQTHKASHRTRKSNEATGKDGRGKQSLPSSHRNGGSNQLKKSSSRITDVKDTNAGKPPKQPGSIRKSDVKKQKTRKHDVPSPLINRSDESAIGRKKPEKSHISPDFRNFMEVKNTLELSVRLRCSCEGCISSVRKAVLKFKGVQSVEVKAYKDMVKVIGSMEKKELVSYLEEKLRWNLVAFPIKTYDNAVNERYEDEADGGPMTDCSPGISTTVQSTCQYSSDDDGIMQPFESILAGNEPKVSSTVILKIRQYCQEGCVQQTRKTVESFKGVESLDINADESQVTVTGTMKVKELVSYLQKKLKREVVLVSVKRTQNVTNECKGLLQNGKNIVTNASGGYGEEMEKVSKVVEMDPYRVKNVLDARDIRPPLVMKMSNKSKTMPKVYIGNLNELKDENADPPCPQHNCQYGSVGDKVHHLEKVVKVGVKGMHKEENVSTGRDLRSQKASKNSKANSRVHPVTLDEQTKMSPHLSQNKTRSGINGDTMHHLENSMEGKRQNKVSNLMTFGLYCDEEYLEKTRETAMSFEGVELAKIDANKGLIMVIGAVDRKKLQLYLKENLKRDVLVALIWKNDTTSDGNKVLTNICGVNCGQVKGDIDVVQWLQKLKEDSVRCGTDGYMHQGADEANMKVKEVAAFSNVNGAWRKDNLGEAYSDINIPYQQNYGGDSQFQWMYPPYRYVSPFSDEDTQSCSIM